MTIAQNFIGVTLSLRDYEAGLRHMSIEGSDTFMLKKYREWIYGIGVTIIVVTFLLLIMSHDSSGPFWEVRQIRQNVKIWAGVTSVMIILMVLVGYFTRNKK